MPAYRNGHCAQCNTRLMVRDCDGEFNSVKPNHREAYLHFGDGHSIKVPVCEACLKNPNFTNIMTALKHSGSIAKDFVKRNDLPLRMKEQPTGLQNGGKVRQHAR